MKTYRIVWAKYSYSLVEAKSKKEALEKARRDEDYGWEDPDDCRTDTYYNVEERPGWYPIEAEEEEYEEEDRPPIDSDDE